MAHARTFNVVERDGYRIVDLRGSTVDWGGVARGPSQHVRLVLVPHSLRAPAMTGDLAGAQIVRTPVRRIAVNGGPHEAMLTALGVDDRLVAVGGTFSYNDSIRDRVLAKDVRQIGYGWHSAPQLDVLVAARPDVFLMALGDLDHVGHMERVQAMGIPVVPTFLEAEPHYLGRVDYVRLVGLLTGREPQADAYVAMVTSNIDRLRARVADLPKRPLLYAWFGGGDRWMATVRNAKARMISDVGGVNPLLRPDDPDRDGTMWVSTETLLQKARDAECWVIRDDHSQPFRERATLRRFRAWNEGCVFAADGMMKPRNNAYDLYERAVIRPDLVMEDLAGMLHPELDQRHYVYIRPDQGGILQ